MSSRSKSGMKKGGGRQKRSSRNQKKGTRQPQGAVRARPRRRVRTSTDQLGESKRASVRSAPASVGMILPRSRFGFMGPAQRLADQDSQNSLRLSGCDLFSTAIQAGTTGNGGFGATTKYYVPLTPSTISARVASVEAMFQWWIIRRLRVHYVPTCGTSTSVSLALGYVTDAQLTVDIPTPTQQQVLEYAPSLITPVWQVASMEIKAQGTKLYESYASSGETTDSKQQGLLAATLLNGGTSSVVYGQLWLEYVIDFYQPSAVISPLDLRRRQARDHVPVPEQKEESPPDTGSWDGMDMSPPRFVPTPSSSLGGTLEKGSSSSTPRIPSRK